MFVVRKRIMDPKVIGQQWAKFLRWQVAQLSNQTASTEEDNLSNNPYYSKYADKLKNVKLDQEKVNRKIDLNEEEQKIKEKLAEMEGKLKKKQDAAECEPVSQQQQSKAKFKKLDDVMKLDLIKDLSKEEIKKIWFEYFKTKDSTIFAFLDGKNYDAIKENARKYPVFTFLLPVDSTTSKIEADDLVNKNNYQFVLVQFQENPSTKSLQCLFTPLAFFHTHRENAPATLILNYYTDIKQDKDVVLMEGEYDNKVFNLLEAQCLANQIWMFYSDQGNQELLENFTKNPQQFDYMTVVKEFEKSLQI